MVEKEGPQEEPQLNQDLIKSVVKSPPTLTMGGTQTFLFISRAIRHWTAVAKENNVDKLSGENIWFTYGVLPRSIDIMIEMAHYGLIRSKNM